MICQPLPLPQLYLDSLLVAKLQILFGSTILYIGCKLGIASESMTLRAIDHLKAKFSE